MTTKITWWKPLLAAVGVALPAVFNYFSARLEADEAKIRAQVAYETMVSQVTELRKTVHDLELDHAELEGKVYELERVKAARMGEAPPKVPHEHKDMADAPLPFEDAVLNYKASKK